MKKTPGIIIGGWDVQGFPLVQDGKENTMIQVYVRPLGFKEDLKQGESHWISAEDHRRIMRSYRAYIIEEIAVAKRNEISRILGTMQLTHKEFEYEI